MSISQGSHEAVSSPQSHFIKSFTCHPPHSSEHRAARAGEQQQKCSELGCYWPVEQQPGRRAESQTCPSWPQPDTALKYHEQSQTCQHTPQAEPRTFKLSAVAKFKPRTDCKQAQAHRSFKHRVLINHRS